jgi:hypothetical protein
VVNEQATSPLAPQDLYTYEGTEIVPPPAVTAVEPSSGPQAGGTAVTITGSNLSGAISVRFGFREASFKVNSNTSISAVAPAGSGTVDVTVETPPGLSATSAADHYTYISTAKSIEFSRALLAGSLTPTPIGQPITLPEGSNFTGSGQVNTETGAGSFTGKLAVPPFVATLNLFGVVPVSLGMRVTEAASVAGTLEKSTSVAGAETVKIPLGLNLQVTSLSMLGLRIPAECTTIEPVSLSLAETLTLEELSKTGLSFSGSTTVPRFRCEGLGFLGYVFGFVLTDILSGPQASYALSIGPPAIKPA